MGKASKRNGRAWGDGVWRGSEGSAPPSRCGQLCHLPLPAGNPGGFVTTTLLSSSLTDNHLLPMHVARLHTQCVFKLDGVGASLRGVSPAPPMSKMLPRMSDLEPPCPLLQPKSRGAREGCPGMGCWYQLQAAGPHAGAPAGEQECQCNHGTLQRYPAAVPCAQISAAKQSKGSTYFMFKVAAAQLFLQETQLCVCYGDECSARSCCCTPSAVPRGGF